MKVEVIQNVQHRQGGGPGNGPVFKTDCEEEEEVTSNLEVEEVDEETEISDEKSEESQEVGVVIDLEAEEVPGTEVVPANQTPKEKRAAAKAAKKKAAKK